MSNGNSTQFFPGDKARLTVKMIARGEGGRFLKKGAVGTVIGVDDQWVSLEFPGYSQVHTFSHRILTPVR